jgi:hypothetical protein
MNFLFKLEICSKFEFCSNSIFVQTRNLFNLNFVQKLKFQIVQISEKNNKNKKENKLLYWAGPTDTPAGGAILAPP